MEIPKEKETQEEKKRITGYFSQEFYLGREDLASFLRALADEIEGSEELKITTDEWELPFRARDQAEVEIELEDDELEIEIEFEKSTGTGSQLSVG